MKRSDKKKLFLCILTTTIFGFSQSLAANLYVSPTGSGDNCTEANPCSFQTALDIANGNGEDDTIYVSGGTYNVNSTLTYTNDDGDGGHSLTIQAKDPDNKPILDGGGNVQIMKVVTDENSDGGDAGGDVTIDGLIFKNGNSTENGGGVYVQTGLANVEISNTYFENNITKYRGGGTYISSNKGVITIQNSTFRNNIAPSYYGGGVYVTSDNRNINIQDSTFENNTAKLGGGAELYSYNGNITVQNSKFLGNYAYGGTTTGKGGGLYAKSYSGSVNVSNSTFENNTAIEDGGGANLFSDSGNVTIQNSEFKNNTTNSTGGGTYANLSSGSITIESSTFENNTSQREGGGAYVDLSSGNITIESSTFENNTSQREGGGAYVEGAFINDGNTTTTKNTITIKNSTFKNNIAEQSGGGLCAYYSNNTSILSSTFESNIASNGGGTFISFSNNVTIESSTFRNNTAKNYDGGGAVIWSGNAAIVRNSIFGNNITNASGGGLSISGSKATLVNNSFYKNSAYDGGGAYFWLDNSTIGNIYNNILWQNEATNGKDIYVNTDTMEDGNDAVVKIYNNDFTSNDFSGTSQSSTLYVTGTENYTQENNISSDPLFRDPEKGDFHLEADSPCIDKGTNDAPELPSTDKDGNHRIRGKNVDMGAYESSGESSNESSSAISITATTSNGTIEENGTLEVTFSIIGDTNETEYVWNFGDGNETTISNKTITHTYSNGGIYNATCQVGEEILSTTVIVYEEASVTTENGKISLKVDADLQSFEVVDVIPIPGIITPYGAISYRVKLQDGINCANVTLTFPSIPAGVKVKLYKCDINGNCNRIDGTSVTGNNVTFEVCDNDGFLDTDNTPGIIYDPLQFGYSNSTTSEDNGGCSIVTPSTPAAGLFNTFLMLSGLAGLGLGTRRKK